MLTPRQRADLDRWITREPEWVEECDICGKATRPAEDYLCAECREIEERIKDEPRLVPGARCVVCGVEPVCPEEGFDTCAACARRI